MLIEVHKYTYEPSYKNEVIGCIDSEDVIAFNNIHATSGISIYCATGFVIDPNLRIIADFNNPE
jgi:hypothetical protein